VTSSSIASVGYRERDAVLEVELVGGAVYRYFDVPRAAYDALMHAPSHGRYFNAAIRAGGYRYQRAR